MAQLSCLSLNLVVRFQRAHCMHVTKSIYTFYPELPIILGPIDGNVIEYWNKMVQIDWDRY